jgi:hypothetical protein
VLTRSLLLALAAACASAQAACLGDRCSPGQVLAEGACVPRADGASDARADGRGDGLRDGYAGESVPLGAACDRNSQCKGETSFCVVMPGKTVGYCTKTGCEEGRPGSCPPGYTCLDLSRFVPGLPTACIKP